MKMGKATAPSQVNTEMIIASSKIGVKLMIEQCQRVPDGKGIPNKCKTSVVVQIYKKKMI